ncbi:hypothetical protein LguiA_020011 [Lonicera macranthoides]
MEDENGLELSLGLTCGGSSATAKGKNGNSSETRTDEADRGSKLIDDFKNFLHGGTQKQDSSMRPQGSAPVTSGENFFNNLSKPVTVNADASNLNGGGFWVPNDNRSTEVEEEKRSEAGSKRKGLFEEINHQKKREREAQQNDLHDKTKTSHISITTDEGSTGDNEDVADSEADGSTSRLVPHHDEGSKRRTGSGDGLYEANKEVHGVSDSRFTISSEKDFKLGNMSYGVQFPPQSVNILNMPYSLPMKESNSNPSSGPETSGYLLPGMMQVMNGANGERQGNLPVMNANVPVMFGYSPVQLPVLDKDNSRGLVSHPQQFHPSYFGRGPPNLDKHSDAPKISQAVPASLHKSPETTQYEGRTTLERPKTDPKHHPTEEGGSSSHTEENAKGSNANTIIKVIGTSDQPRPEGFPSEYPAIRPGIASDVKFGGSGSYPNLPWVSTTGPGPNGRTISGVTYRFSATQIRIVCACHGSHMSPEEFVQHASEEQTNADAGSGLSSVPGNNPATSAQS